MQIKLLGIISVDLHVKDERLVTFRAIFIYLRKKWECNGAMKQLFIDLRIQLAGMSCTIFSLGLVFL